MVGGVLLAIPHWIFDPYDPSSALSSALSVSDKEELIEGGLCRANHSVTVSYELNQRRLMSSQSYGNRKLYAESF